MPLPPFSGAHESLTAQATTAAALADRALAQIETDAVGAFVHTDADAVRAQADALDARLARGEKPPLAGLMLGVKDTICTTDFHTTCGSRMLQGFRSLFDATAVARLREAGAIVVGKLNCDEFAMGSSNETSVYGPTRNPAAPDYVPGGSSGGSAAAVAAGLVHAALGSDTGGSIRQPAAFCGCVGLKPTYGRVSRYGLVAFASSFDCIGPFAPTVAEAGLLLQTMAGADPNDVTSAPSDVPDLASAYSQGVDGLTVGLPKEFLGEGLDPEIQARIEAAAAHLEAQGANVREVSLPHTRYGIAAYYVLTTAEASSNLARYDGVRYGFRSGQTADDLEAFYVNNRTEGFGAEVKRRLMLGTYVLSSGYYDAYYGRAQRVRRLFQQDYTRAFEEVDVLLTPATPTPAWKLGDKSDPLAMYLSDVYTVTANLAGIPGLSVPAGATKDGLPIGVQLLGPAMGEATLLRAGHVLESLA
jgi:aspartyl-tRNA(Asn)/glutamyl-tRNA(Gln) amidotransferase subunit A